MIDVAVIGGGIGGLAVARFLLNAGLQVRVFERARSLEDTGAGIWMTPNAMGVLDRLGLAEQVEAAGVDIEVASLRDQSGRAIGAVDYRRVDTAHGFGTVSIRRSDLQAILIEALPGDVVQLEAELVHLDETGPSVEVKLRGGASVAAKLLIGADGMRSRVRGCIRPEVQPRPVGGVCWRGVADVEAWLASSPRATEFWGDGTRFGKGSRDKWGGWPNRADAWQTAFETPYCEWHHGGFRNAGSIGSAIRPWAASRAIPLTREGRPGDERAMTDASSGVMFEEHRPRLIRLAYQMTGSLAEAEDIVQDAYLRWDAVDRASLRSPTAWLTTVVSRLCLDAQKAAWVRRAAYPGPWLPEPVPTAPEHNPFDHAQLADTLSIAMLQLLERLTPAERAAFILREAFEYTYEDIAEALGKNAPACRQLVRRAREHLRRERPRFDSDPAEHAELLERFVAASSTGEVDPLLEVLADGVVLLSDGGGKVLAALNPIRGAEKVARFLVGVRDKQPEGQSYALHEINGRPAIVGYVGGEPRFTTSFDVRGARIHGIHIVMNPDKLRAVPDAPTTE